MNYFQSNGVVMTRPIIRSRKGLRQQVRFANIKNIGTC
jgi:hypothetical protein